MRTVLRRWVALGAVGLAGLLHGVGLHELEGGLLDQWLPVLLEYAREER